MTTVRINLSILCRMIFHVITFLLFFEDDYSYFGMYKLKIIHIYDVVENNTLFKT